MLLPSSTIFKIVYRIENVTQSKQPTNLSYARQHKGFSEIVLYTIDKRIQVTLVNILVSQRLKWTNHLISALFTLTISISELSFSRKKCQFFIYKSDIYLFFKQCSKRKKITFIQLGTLALTIFISSIGRS